MFNTFGAKRVVLTSPSDGTEITAGGGATGSAGSPNPAVTSVQGVPNGTPQNVQTMDISGTRTLDLTTTASPQSITMPSGAGVVGFRITGLTGSGATVQVERSNDGGTNWGNANTTASSSTASLSSTLTADDPSFRVAVAGATMIRFRVTVVGTGSASIVYNVSASTGLVALASLLPSTTTPGNGVIGGVNIQTVGNSAITLGQKTAAASFPVTLASDGTYATAANQVATGTAAQTVQGNVASGAADAGNPVKAGAVYRAIRPTFTDGQRGDLQISPKGDLSVFVANQSTGAPVTIQGPNVGDGVATNAFAGFTVLSVPYNFNGSTLDRQKKPNLVARLVSAAASTNAVSVKTSAGDVFRIRGRNNSTSTRYLKLYNKASAPTVGTDVPFMVEELLPSSGFDFNYSTFGLYFGTGIAYAITSGGADSDATAITAGDITSLSIMYTG